MCNSTISLKQKEKRPDGSWVVRVPCGKCVECRKAKLSAWLFRFQYEQLITANTLFITLTYAPEHLPFSVDQQPTLNKRDVQLFLKRLRKQHSKHSSKSLRYYFVGEYGTRRGRPHYHAILFNVVPERIDLINSCWGLGLTEVSNVTQARIKYCLKYISKPRTKVKGRVSEFSMVSKGFGRNYLNEDVISWHLRSPAHSYVSGFQGEKYSMPKYYKELIYTDKDFRFAVTEYLQQRVEISFENKLNQLSRLYPDFSRTKLIKILSNWNNSLNIAQDNVPDYSVF